MGIASSTSFPMPRSCVSRPQRGARTTLVLAVREPSRDASAPGMVRRIVRFGLWGGAMVCLAGNAINSTRLALNSFQKPPQLGTDLTGKNLMVHVRGNYSWRIRKSALQLPVPHRTWALARCMSRVESPLTRTPSIDWVASTFSSMPSAATTTITRSTCIASSRTWRTSMRLDRLCRARIWMTGSWWASGPAVRRLAT